MPVPGSRLPGKTVVLALVWALPAFGHTPPTVFAFRGAPTAPPAADADADGLPDPWETQHGLDPANPADARTDLDGDGLDAAAECRLGGDPWNPDTNHDGIPDGAAPAADAGALQPDSAMRTRLAIHQPAS